MSGASQGTRLGIVRSVCQKQSKGKEDGVECRWYLAILQLDVALQAGVRAVELRDLIVRRQHPGARASGPTTSATRGSFVSQKPLAVSYLTLFVDRSAALQ